jgi:hypothetical protein
MGSPDGQGKSTGLTPEVLPSDSEELTRSDVAKWLGVSLFKVRTMEQRGELQPRRRGPDGTRFFAVVDIKALAEALVAHRAPDVLPLERARAGRPVDPRTDGEIAAEVFRLFDEDKTLSEIVQQVGVVPEKIRGWFSEWTLSLEAGENRRLRRLQAEADEREAVKLEEMANRHEARMKEMEKMTEAMGQNLGLEDGTERSSARRKPGPPQR